MRAVRSRLATALVQVRYLCGRLRTRDVARRGHLRRIRGLLSGGELHLNLQLLGLLRGQRLYGRVVAALLVRRGGVLGRSADACTGGGHVWMLLLRAAVDGARQRLVVADRLDLALGDLLDLLRALTCHILCGCHISILVDCVMRIGQVRGLLLALALGCLLRRHLPGHHIFETADHLRALGTLVVLASEREVILRLGLILALHLMNKFVLNLI